MGFPEQGELRYSPSNALQTNEEDNIESTEQDELIYDPPKIPQEKEKRKLGLAEPREPEYSPSKILHTKEDERIADDVLCKCKNNGLTDGQGT